MSFPKDAVLPAVRFLSRVALIVLLTILAAPMLRAHSGFYDFANLPVSWAAGINNRGQIVGFLLEEAGPPFSLGKAFVYEKGDIVAIVAPFPGGEQTTRFLGINASGQIIGTFGNRFWAGSFVYRAGKYTKLEFPGSALTLVRAINDRGQIVGVYDSSDFRTYDFLYDNGKFTTIDLPGDPTGINNRGQIVGYYLNETGNTHGFLFENGQSETIDYPDAFDTWISGINNQGQMVGYYYGHDWHSHGFLLDNGRFTTIDVPGTSDTYIWGLNDQGQLLGESSITGAFVATPHP